MASSDNLVTMEPWAFRSTFADSWMSENFLRENETLTKALQKSISHHPDIFPNDMVSAFFRDPDVPTMIQNPTPIPTPTPTPTLSGPTVSGGSENETAGSKRRNVVGGANGRITKRKSRASKRTTTTYITADAANFRQMVQQVTGVRFGVNGQLPVVPVLKPEPHRVVNRIQPGGCLPTLDTSAFLLDQNTHQQQQQQQHHRHQQQLVGPTSSLVVPSVAAMTAPPPAPPPSTAEVGSTGFDFDSFSSFPTLESWKVM